MGNLTYVTGGIRSGKSRFVLEKCKKYKEITFIVSAYSCDDEMKERIKKHREERPKEWQTIEIESGIIEKVQEIQTDIVVIDCLTLYLSRLLDENPLIKVNDVLKELNEFLKMIKKKTKQIFIISNEIGMGVIPDNKMSRKFIDILGAANKYLAEKADESYILISGKPIRI